METKECSDRRRKQRFCSSILIKKRRYSAALQNVDVIHAPVAARLGTFRINLAAIVIKQTRLRSFHVAEPLVLLREIITDVAEASLLVASFQLPAARGLDRDRLRQARRHLLAAAAAAAGAVVAEEADH